MKINSINIVLFAICLISYSYFYQSGQHNENSRFDQIRSVIENNTWEIDKFAHNSADIIEYQNHVYPNKAPGTTYLGIPAWYIASKLVKILGVNTKLADHLVCYLTTVIMVSSLSALLSISLLNLLRMRLAEPYALGLTLSFAFGTIAFPFSTLFFSHQIVAALLFFSFALLVNLKNRLTHLNQIIPSHKINLIIVLSGACLGFGITTEYPVAIGIPWLILYCATSFHYIKAPLMYCLGVFLGLIPLFAYNLKVYGKLFYSAYSVYAEIPNPIFEQHKSGFLGVSLPSIENLWLILFSEQRGLFFLNPTLIFTFLSIPLLLKSNSQRKESLVSLCIVISFIIFNASYGSGLIYAGGGASIGPRHIIPMLPFAIYCLSDCWKYLWVRLLMIMTTLYSVFVMTLATAIEPRIGYEFENPLMELLLPGYFNGWYAIEPNGVFSSQFITTNSVAFNWGKLLNLPPTLQLAPLLLFWMIAGIYLFRRYKMNFVLRSFLILVATFFIFTPFFLQKWRNLDSNTTQGLTANYFSEIPWEGCDTPLIYQNRNVNLTIKRLDHEINYDWVNEPMRPFRSPFAVEWSGIISTPINGNYKFMTESDDGSCLYIDNKLIVDNWGEHDPQRKEGETYLSEGRHNITIRYYDLGYGAMIRTFWSIENGPFIILPSDRLSPE